MNAGKRPEQGAAAKKADRQPVVPHVMLVDNDPGIRRMVADYLGQNNMRVTATAGTRDALRLLTAERFSLVILDLQPGRENAFGILRGLRARFGLPVITLAGAMQDENDRILSLELGADDCIVKPFSLRELLARVRVVFRRVETASRKGACKPARAEAPPQLRFGRWVLDRRTRRVIDATGTPVALTKGEYALLLAFLDAPQRPLSREHLIKATKIQEDVLDRTIDVQVLRLRRKLDAGPGASDVIRTERGAGYVFIVPVFTMPVFTGPAEVIPSAPAPGGRHMVQAGCGAGPVMGPPGPWSTRRRCGWT